MGRTTLAWITASLAAAGTAGGQSLLYQDYGNGFDDNLGHAVAGGADIDRDGFDDLVVGAPYTDTGGLTDNGAVRVISGRTGGVLFKRDGDRSGDRFGWSVAIAGDVNGDGWPDVIAGAPYASDSGGNPGLARVFSGKTGKALTTVYGDSTGDEFGFAVGGGLDWDGDGQADFVVGIPGYDWAPSVADSGRVHVYSGASGASIGGFVDSTAGERAGTAVSGEGDFDGDGINDLVIGIPGGLHIPSGSTPKGKVYVEIDKGWGSYSIYGDSAGDRFGESVATGLDVDGDGHDELLAGAPGDDDGGADAGSVRLWNVHSGLPLHTWHGEATADQLGASVAACGDLDGDGVRDVLAGATEEGGGTGRVQAFGSNSYVELLRLVGDPQSRFGHAVADAGDFNADGVPDVAAGGPQAFNPSNPLAPVGGLVRVHSLAAPGFVNYCTAGTSASGCQAQISGSGMPSATAASGFFLSATGVEGKSEGMFFFGTSGRQASPWGNGTSFQCVQPPAHRVGLQKGVGQVGKCDGQFSRDLNANWCPTCPKAHHNPGAGALVQAQLWYRDPSSTSNQTTSLSNALELGVGP